MDLTQDTFVAAFRGLQGYDEKKAEFRTWLYRIAANKVADHYRSKYYHRMLSDLSLDSVEYEIPDDTDILESPAVCVVIEQIMAIVSGYELTWVSIFQMKIFEEKTFAQIGKELNLSENTVKCNGQKVLS